MYTLSIQSVLPIVVLISVYLKSNPTFGPKMSWLFLVACIYFVNCSHQKKNITSILKMSPELQLPRRLAKLWLFLLELPSIEECSSGESRGKSDNSCNFRLSLIVPAYAEKGKDIIEKLQAAYNSCEKPGNIEIILVDAGKNVDLDLIRKEDLEKSWGSFKLVRYHNGDGRGPTLNFGAKDAKGQILTFLHSDVILPLSWDSKIYTSFNRSEVLMSAFSFGIDKCSNGNDPPGIKAVETTANLRTHMYKLPYGDQVLSMPSAIFRYLGGFPYQCLMEDYELVALVRKRILMRNNEALNIIGGAPSLCSPRRWQKHGVLKVTYTNSYLVNMYNRGLSPDAIFKKYYGSNVKVGLSPWEKKI